ncbi:MAG: amidohydrolase family protein [Candidatus Deferrimicrobiaceae bacterium]
MTSGGRGTIYTASRVVADAGTIYSPGAVAVENGVVVAAGAPGDVEREVPEEFDRVDLHGLAILPGLVNAHTHLSIPRLPGREGIPASSSLSFVDWILRLIEWRWNAPPGEFADNVGAAAGEAVSGGTTTIGEIAGPDIAAYASLPMRARIFAEGIGFHPEVAGAVLSSVEENVAWIAGISRAGGRLAPGISPHTLYTVGPDLLRGLADLGARLGLPLALHMAESPAEMEFLATGGGEVSTRLYPAVGKDVSFFRGIGMSVPSYLRTAGILREGLVLVHNVHLSRGEIDELRSDGARFVLCPRSNAAHRNGLPDVTHFVDAGIPFALGTDSLGSVGSLSMWDEMREAAGLYRGGLPEEELCRSLFRAATESGARLLGLSSGTLLPGAPADFVAIDDPDRASAGWAFSRMVDRVEDRDVRLTVIAGERIHERP